MSDADRYRKLLKLSEDAGLTELKAAYASYRARFQGQLQSDRPETVEKGRNNLLLLDQAYQNLAPLLAANRTSRDQVAAAEPPSTMSVELGHCRIGFHINRIEGFQVVGHHNRGHFKVNWPTGKLVLYDNKLKIKALIFKTEIDYRHIDEIRRFWFLPMVFQIRHRQADVWPTVIINGFGVGRRIKALNDAHRLGLNLTY